MQFQPSHLSGMFAASDWSEAAPAPGTAEDVAATAAEEAEKAKRKAKRQRQRRRAALARAKRQAIWIPLAVGGGVLVLGLGAIFALRASKRKAPPAIAAAPASVPAGGAA